MKPAQPLRGRSTLALPTQLAELRLSSLRADARPPRCPFGIGGSSKPADRMESPPPFRLLSPCPADLSAPRLRLKAPRVRLDPGPNFVASIPCPATCEPPARRYTK